MLKLLKTSHCLNFLRFSAGVMVTINVSACHDMKKRSTVDANEYTGAAVKTVEKRFAAKIQEELPPEDIKIDAPEVNVNPYDSTNEQAEGQKPDLYENNLATEVEENPNYPEHNADYAADDTPQVPVINVFTFDRERMKNDGIDLKFENLDKLTQEPFDHNHRLKIINELLNVHFRKFKNIFKDLPYHAVLDLASFEIDIIDHLKTKYLKDADLHTIKTEADTILGVKNYNKDAKLLPYLFARSAPDNQQMQCLSGTYLLQATYAALTASEEEYENRNLVTIMTPGHILPGYMVKDKDGNWNLHGIESTVLGAGHVDFGPIKTLISRQPKLALRIIDAALWLNISLVESYLAKPAEVLDLVLEATNIKYDGQIPVKELEEKIKQIPGYSSQGQGTFGAFGESKTPAGNMLRPTLDTLPIEQYEGFTLPAATVTNQTNITTPVTVYKVRIAAYRNLKNFDKSKVENLGVIEQEINPDNARETIILLSGYKSQDEATEAKDKARKQGFKTAYLVQYIDGKLQTAGTTPSSGTTEFRSQ